LQELGAEVVVTGDTSKATLNCGSGLDEVCLLKLDCHTKSDSFLLTNTAEKFVARWGFQKIQRTEIPADLMQSSALNNFCPASSICMKLEL
jgi:N-acetylglutamate synthase-like GNAT family acetyltransferase